MEKLKIWAHQPWTFRRDRDGNWFLIPLPLLPDWEAMWREEDLAVHDAMYLIFWNNYRAQTSPSDYTFLYPREGAR